MQEQKQRLLIDFDDTICQSVFLKKVNEFLNTNYKIEEFTDYMIDDIVPKNKRDEFFKTFFDIDPYEGLPLIKGAKEALKKLNKKLQPMDTPTPKIKMQKTSKNLVPFCFCKPFAMPAKPIPQFSFALRTLKANFS